MSPSLRIAIVSRQPALYERLEIRLQSKGYQVLTLGHLPAVLGIVYSDPPDIIIIDLSVPEEELLGVIESLKGDSFFSTIPLIGLMEEKAADTFDWVAHPLDDFVTLPLRYPELFNRILLSVERIKRVFDNNPLTKLPGNTSIQQAIERTLGTPNAICCVDINNFKPYNDTYGFSHGDEVLRMLARIMFNSVMETGGFVGHIGGDDFVFIVPLGKAKSVCETIIDNFEKVVGDLFDDQTKASGYYVGKNRKGTIEKFPLLGVSIAIVSAANPGIMHYGKVAEVAAELKKLAKENGRSTFVMDQRQDYPRTEEESAAGAVLKEAQEG